MYADTIQRVIETQIRLIVGTVAMFIIGSLIFGVNFVSYGVAHVTHMAFYIEGALLVIMIFGYPANVVDLVWDFVDWWHGVNGKYQIFTRIAYNVASEFFSNEELGYAVENVSESNEAAGKFLLEIEEEIRKQLPAGVESSETRGELRKLIPEEERKVFDALYLAADTIETARLILTGRENFFSMVKDPHKLNGKDIIPMIEAETAEEAVTE